MVVATGVVVVAAVVVMRYTECMQIDMFELNFRDGWLDIMKEDKQEEMKNKFKQISLLNMQKVRNVAESEEWQKYHQRRRFECVH